MNFLVADSFTASLARLTGSEQKAVKTTAFDLQINPVAPGLSFHRLDRAKDKNFWSLRVNDDIRIIAHRTSESLLLAYVGHHDVAYAWAERRKLERHPTTGAMQLVEIRERVEEVGQQRSTRAENAARHPVEGTVSKTPSKPKLFSNLTKVELLSFGVPEDWVNDVRSADEDTLLDVLTHLPEEAREAILKLAVGEKPEPQPVISPDADPFSHPDSQRRFRVMTNVDELRLALEYPWDKWAVFLHPAQAALTTRHYSGPARVSGSAGTGKTIVALHRAVALARKNPTSKVLLTTFSKALANALRRKLVLLAGEDKDLLSRIRVDALNAIAYDLYAEAFGQPNMAAPSLVRNILHKAAATVEGHKFSFQFLLSEWDEVVDAWQLKTWEAYRDVPRLGRKTRVGGKQREVLWAIFKTARTTLAERKLVTWSDVFGRLADRYAAGAKLPFEFAVVDEAQDLDVAQARFLAALADKRDNALFFSGDLGQRIFQQPFSWKALGLDVRGRSTTLRINYRTSHQIRSQADKLLPSTISDVDGIAEGRRGTISLFDGPPPVINLVSSQEAERTAVGEWLKARSSEGVKNEEIAVFVRSENELKRAREAVKWAGYSSFEMTDKAESEPGKIAISTMHLAKGHEYRVVVVMACDDDVVPLAERLDSVGDESELEAVYDTERHLLYVACTRARDRLLITGIKPGSVFLGDMA
jgi:hypothetical protein